MKSLLKGLLTKDPAKRLSDPAAIKGHKFFEGVDWNEMSLKDADVPIPSEKVVYGPQATLSEVYGDLENSDS